MGRKGARLNPVFVDVVPQEVVEGCLYVSLKYRTVTHKCACGCGREINTPLHPTGWSLTYDGDAVSLWPSVGNWSEHCQSHYVIDKNAVRWSKPWNKEEILEERQRRTEEIGRYYGHEEYGKHEVEDEQEGRSSLLRKIITWMRHKVSGRQG